MYIYMCVWVCVVVCVCECVCVCVYDQMVVYNVFWIWKNSQMPTRMKISTHFLVFSYLKNILSIISTSDYSLEVREYIYIYIYI